MQWFSLWISLNLNPFQYQYHFHWPKVSHRQFRHLFQSEKEPTRISRFKTFKNKKSSIPPPLAHPPLLRSHRLMIPHLLVARYPRCPRQGGEGRQWPQRSRLMSHLDTLKTKSLNLAIEATMEETIKSFFDSLPSKASLDGFGHATSSEEASICLVIMSSFPFSCRRAP